MGYTLEQLAGDCRNALREKETMAAREAIRTFCSRACLDEAFVAAHFGPDNTSARRILYEDPEFGFCILSHVHEGADESRPHDHGPSWAIYSQAEGSTLMTDWRAVKAASGDTPGVVEPVRTYTLDRGDAHLYHEGDVHSPRREGLTKLLRVEGRKMDDLPRGYFDPA